MNLLSFLLPYAVFCVVSGAIVLAASGDFHLRRSLAQGLGVCALGLATLWAWAFVAPAAAGGSTGEVLRSCLDLLLALAALGALCNHGRPAADRFAILTGGLFLLALADSLATRGGLVGEAPGLLLVALPILALALVAAIALAGIRVDPREARSGRLVVTLSLLAMGIAITALVYDHYSRLSAGTILLASLTLLVGAVQLVVAQRGWRDARARARLAEIGTAPAEFAGLDAALTVDLDGRILACNERARRIFHREEAEIVGKPVGALLDGAPRWGSFEEVLAAAGSEGLSASVELSAYGSGGISFPVEVAIGPLLGESSSRSVLVRDISERRRREEENRRLAAIVRSSEDAVVTKDLSGKITAWNQGAERLYGYAPEEAIGRHVGELLIPPERRAEHRRVLEEAVRGETVSFETRRITKDGRLIDVSLRAFPVSSVSGEVTAVCTVAHDVSERRRRERAEAQDREAQLWRGRLRQAVGSGNLLFHGQPIIELATGALHHHELLVRMRLEGQLIRPGAFLPFVEEGELIRDLDLWAIERGTQVARDLPVAINLSARSLGSRGLLNLIERRLAEDDVAPENLIFEITETAAAENMQGARELVRELTQLGCGVALDDFGTGYGSFTYLRHLPVTQLKIDTEFISGIRSDATDQRVVESMVAVARNFEMTTVAEGVEDRDTFELLGDLGIDMVQGYYVGRPQPLDLGAVRSNG
ncbi:MAG TPA: EAL domain-containing protein [Solirubrobacterales bacterium]|nr:EAL domain-containing protein [Solirubrobacterales bacterium]